MKITLREVPSGTRNLFSVHHGMVSVAEWPLTTECRSFRRYRKALNLMMSDAATRLGVSTLDIARLENGQYTCDWILAMKLLGGS